MAVRRKPGGILEMTGRHTERRSVLVHHFSEYAFAARDMFSERDAGIVARLHDEPHQQLANGYASTDFDEHARTFRAPCLFAHNDLMINRKNIETKKEPDPAD